MTKISAVHLANLLSYKDCMGLNEKKVSFLLKNPHNKIDVHEFFAAFDTLIQKEANEHLGLHCGSLLSLKAMEFVSQVTFSTSSIRQMIYVIQQYLKNTFPLIDLALTATGKNAIIQLNSSLNDSVIRKHLLDGAFCFVFRALQTVISASDQLELRLPYENLDEYKKFLKTHVKTGEGFCFIFDENLLNKEINHKRVKEIEMLLPKFLTMLYKENPAYKPFSLQVRNRILYMCTPELPVFPQVAAHFHLGERTFQRKLAEEKQSFRKITDDIKKELASYLLKGNRMKTRDIAFLLGYSDSSAYLHAYKKWKLPVYNT